MNRETGKVTDATVDQANGTLSRRHSQGQYTVESGAVRTSLTALSAGSYQLDLRREKAVDFSAGSKGLNSTEVLLQVAAEGMGAHTFTVASSNLELTWTRVPSQVGLRRAQQERNHLACARHRSSIALGLRSYLPDGQLNQHQELTGIACSNK